MNTQLQALCDRATPQELKAIVSAIFDEFAQRIAAHPNGAAALNAADDAYRSAPYLDSISLHQGCICRAPGLRAWHLCIALPNSPTRTRLLNIIQPPEFGIGTALSA